MTFTRFAPSPTGLLHAGHALAAKVAYDLARTKGGQFFLRFEDIDTTRVREHYFATIEEDLKWLGFHWDGEPIRQSARLDRYAGALDTLRAMHAVFPCFCTRRDIEHEVAGMVSAPHGPEGPLYPGTCRALDDEQIANRLAAGETPAWRLDSRRVAQPLQDLTFSDRRFGVQAVDPLLLGDVVLARKDIGTSYHLAVVVDDADQGITLVTRGEDLLPSTHVHRILQHLLDLPEPEYLHHPLIVDHRGQRLAKRNEDATIRGIREGGGSPDELFAEFPAPY